jgi:dihydrofolate reductase
MNIRRRDTVRKVVLGMNMTLDGYMGGPGGDLGWLFPQFSENYIRSTSETLREIDTILMGRITNESMASYWPTATDEIAPIMNKAVKFVFSNTLTEVEWTNARVVSGDPADLITELKGQDGRNIGIAGGSRFAQQIIEAGLIDEYRRTELSNLGPHRELRPRAHREHLPPIGIAGAPNRPRGMSQRASNRRGETSTGVEEQAIFGCSARRHYKGRAPHVVPLLTRRNVLRRA